MDGTRGEFKAESRPVPRRQKGFPPFVTFLLFFGIFILILGSLSRILGGIAGAFGLPAFVHLAVLPVGVFTIILLALIGFGAGLFLPHLFSTGGAWRNGSGRHHGGGFFFGPGIGGSSLGGGGFSSGGFSGGGGSFGGGGASGGW